MRFNWIFEIEDYQVHLKAALKDNSDLDLLYEILEKKTGSEAFLEVFEQFLKTNLRFPEVPIKELRRVYVYQNRRKIPARTMARTLGVDEVTVYAWLKDFGINKSSKQSNNNFNMFED
jgi:hypothetical protein